MDIPEPTHIKKLIAEQPHSVIIGLGWIISVIVVALGMTGGVVRLLNDKKDGDKILWRDIIRYLVTAGSVGFVITLVFNHYYPSADAIQLAIAFGSGFASIQIVSLAIVLIAMLSDAVQKLAKGIINRWTAKEEEKNDN